MLQQLKARNIQRHGFEIVVAVVLFPLVSLSAAIATYYSSGEEDQKAPWFGAFLGGFKKQRFDFKKKIRDNKQIK